MALDSLIKGPAAGRRGDGLARPARWRFGVCTRLAGQPCFIQTHGYLFRGRAGSPYAGVTRSCPLSARLLRVLHCRIGTSFAAAVHAAVLHCVAAPCCGATEVGRGGLTEFMLATTHPRPPPPCPTPPPRPCSPSRVASCPHLRLACRGRCVGDERVGERLKGGGGFMAAGGPWQLAARPRQRPWCASHRELQLVCRLRLRLLGRNSAPRMGGSRHGQPRAFALRVRRRYSAGNSPSHIRNLTPGTGAPCPRRTLQLVRAGTPRRLPIPPLRRANTHRAACLPWRLRWSTHDGRQRPRCTRHPASCALCRGASG
jgi:hypothetical protein